MKNWIVGSAILGVALLAAPMWAAGLGHPGAVNYIEGQVSIDRQLLGQNAVGSALVGPGQTLETQAGKAEILLTPGVFLRLGNGSAARVDSDSLTDTRVALLQGEAMVEVDQIYRENHLQIAEGSGTAILEKKGLYSFDANRSTLAVYDGEAKVVEGDRSATVKKGKEISLTGPTLQAKKFDRDVHDDLYNWSNVRSEYLAEAAAQSARVLAVSPTGWFGMGWYWNPWYGMYSFLPGNGFLYSPFGWGFYSPGYIVYAPVGGIGAARGYYHGVASRPAVAPRAFAARPSFSYGAGVQAFHGGLGRH
jgi:hypothetical protein